MLNGEYKYYHSAAFKNHFVPTILMQLVCVVAICTICMLMQLQVRNDARDSSSERCNYERESTVVPYLQ